jgi:hypothetical protein
VDRPRTRHKPSIIQGALLEVWLSFSDHLSVIRGLSSRTTRTARPVSRRAAKFFASCVSLSLCDCLGFVPKVGRFVVTMQPWQTHVETLGCEFGA